MFTRFIKEFENTIVLPAPTGAEVILGDTAMLETRDGWVSPTLLKAGQEVATLDGGFTTVLEVARLRQTPGCYYVPEGAFGNCSALCLPGDSLIGLEAPLGYSEAKSDYVSLPVSALQGHFGVRPVTADAGQMYRLVFAEEEMLWTNTGCLLHARKPEQAFFDTLSFGEARAFLSLLEAGYFDDAGQEATSMPAPVTLKLVSGSHA